jgi:hypothetical protein
LKQFAVRVRDSVEISFWQTIALAREALFNFKIGITALNHSYARNPSIKQRWSLVHHLTIGERDMANRASSGGISDRLAQAIPL